MFPSPPLKFRTAGFPKYGFKLVVGCDLRPFSITPYTHPKPRLHVLLPHRAFFGSWSNACPMATSPEALRSATGCVVPPLQALLWPHLRLSPPPADLCVRRQVFASQPAMRGSPLLSPRVCQRAAFLTPTDQAGAFGCYFPTRTSLRRCPSGSASVSPRAGSQRGSFFEAAKFA